VVGDAVFRDVVIARIVEPTSKADARRVLGDLGATVVSYKTIQRHLQLINTGGYRDAIAAKCFAHAADRGGLSLLLYDVTTLYFEAESEDELRKVGYSKERRIDPQIVVGPLVDRTGFPLEIGCFEGNTAETTTIVPIITSFLQRHDLADTPMVVAADAGMLSASNLKDLDEAGLGFIVGSRAVKAPIDLASHFHWNGDVFADGQIIDTVTPRRGNTVVNDRSQRAEPVWNPEAHPGAWRAVWQYSAQRARRDQQTLNAQESRARAVIAGDKPVKATRFVKVHADGRSLDEASLARAQSLVGLKGYITNIAIDVMPRGRSDLQVPRPVARRALVSDVQDRPTRPPDVSPHPRGDRSPPDHRVHRPGRRPRHPGTHQPGHRQRHQATAPPADRDHHDQRRHRKLPARNPSTPTKNPRQPGHPPTGALSKMS
jgi:Transposase DDE domain